jgi:subfamily B ATP-binding cassette protein MsbA
MATPSGEKNWPLYLRIISYLKPYYKHIILVIFFNFGFVVTSALSVWMVAPVITVFFEEATQVREQSVQEPPPPETAEVSFFDLNAWLKNNIQELLPRGDPLDTLKWLCIFIFFIFLLKNFFVFSEFFWMTYVEQRVVRDLREQVYERIINQSMNFFHKHKTGDLISKITNDINAVNVAVNRSFTKIIRDPILIAIYMTILFSISWKLTFIAIFVLPISAILIRKIGNSLKRRSHRVQERIADITSVLQETISGIKVVKAFAMERYENKKFQRFTREHFKAAMGVGIMAGVVWYGGSMVLQGQTLTSEDFMRFLIILFSTLDPIKSLGEVNNNIHVALASGKRIFDVIDQDNPIKEKPQAIVKTTFQDKITYENVSFRYNPGGELVLKKVNLKVAGKTTLVNLLPRFYDVIEGAIKIDGIDVRDMTLTSLRGLMGIVTQEVLLFNDTVANNIAYGMDKYSMEEIEQAAKLANAYDFIMEMPEGFQTIIGERGMLLSGGQRQRLSIARAILKNPPILIFDEATSSLDSESEFLIQEAIENLMKDRTVFIIAHRLSSIVNSDKIVVMENGEIIDEGTNQELLKRSGRYRQLHELQFNA